MKNLTVLFVLIPAIILNSCTKSSTTPPTIVGAWKITGISGLNSSQGYPGGPVITTTYSYTDPILTEADTSSNTLVTINIENWQFNKDGTFSINENYMDSSTAAIHNIVTLTGWWDYTGSTIPNSTIILRTYSTPTILPVGSAFFIKSVTNTQLVLTVNESVTSYSGSSTTKNFTLTFARQ